LGIGFTLVLGVAACDGPQPDQDELWAILADGELPALSAADPGGGVSAAGVAAFFPGFPFGQWSFDDCNPDRTNLSDSSPSGNTAFRSVGVTCAPGIAGLGVALAVKEDIVYVPDQPNFTFEDGVTVAGWFSPTAIGGTRTLIRKRDKGTSSFALVMTSGGKYQFVVSLGGQAISVTSPGKATVGVLHHVAGTYDGHTLRLYVDGFEVKGLAAGGTIPPGPGPLLIGNDGSERRFDGVIDNVVFEGRPLSNAEILALTCIRQTPTMDVTPRVSAPTPPGVPASFDVAVTNHDSPACSSRTFTFEAFSPGGGISTEPSFAESPPVASGETTHFTMTAIADDTVEPGTFLLQFFVFDQLSFFVFDSVQLIVTEPTGCNVNRRRELMITDVSVVDDFIRTTFAGAPDDPRTGAWTFKRLVESMAPTPADAPAMVEEMLSTFTTTQTINGFSVGPRPGMQSIILNNWPRTPDGALDLTQAPFRLLAIVNRFDLRNLANGDAGEGRFVFGFAFPNSFSLQATMIFEYKLPASTEDDVLGWAQAFHALGSIPFSEDYNAALQMITDRFAGRGARPGHVNDNAINAVRTNEIDFSDNFVWQMRELVLSPETGRLVPATVKLTPDRSFNFTDTLASFINANEAAIIAETHVVPEQFNGQPFLAGAVFNDLGSWFASGINNNEARHHFALNTCNGCHSQQETNTFFLQIQPRFPGSQAVLSGFLTGTTVFDPSSGQQRTFNDLGRRRNDLTAVVCTGAGGGVLRKGIDRVH
jgi:hypothetical protein